MFKSKYARRVRPLNVQYALYVEALREGDALAAPATSYSRDLIEYMTADAWLRPTRAPEATTETTHTEKMDN